MPIPGRKMAKCRTQRILKGSNYLVRDICFMPVNCNSRQTALGPMLKSYQNLWAHWRRNSRNRVLGGDDRRDNDWAATLKDGWLLAGERRMEEDSMNRQQYPHRAVKVGGGGCRGMPSNPIHTAFRLWERKGGGQGGLRPKWHWPWIQS